jgi:WhiB family redox-sensing transcriptional regulator
MTTPKNTTATAGSRGNSKYTYMELLSEWKLIDDDQDWKDEAACRGMDYDTFFPTVGYNQHDIFASKICANCPVRRPCLMFAVNNRIHYGIWGGLTPIRRKKIRPTKWETR